MNERNLTLSGNLRYQPSQLKKPLGYDNLYKEPIRVEIALLEIFIEIGIIPANIAKEFTSSVKNNLLKITTTEVDEMEGVTHHDIRALVRIIQKIVGENLAKYVHLTLTSYDVIETGRALQYRGAYNKALKPSIRELVTVLISLVEEFADQKQIGRTHGQHAIPITVGFWLATILNRILTAWERMHFYSSCLVGKISGIVGAYSTQILPPEPLAYFLFSCCMLSAALAQFGRDARHLMRSEIDEIVESFEKEQVSSSTLSSKRNPVNWEGVEGLWLKIKNEFGKVLDNLLSDHQRDLTGSGPTRDFAIILVNLQVQLNKLLRKKPGKPTFLQRMKVNRDKCEKNLSQNSHLFMSELLYITLQLAGYPKDAHLLIGKELVPISKKTGKDLLNVLEDFAEEDEDLKLAIGRIPSEIWKLLHSPDKYTGKAEQKALEIVRFAKELIKRIDKS